MIMTSAQGNTLTDAHKAVGDPPVTTRQMQVLRLSCEGLRLREIAEELGVSPRTVEHHKYQMMARLNVRTSAQLILYAARRGWV
jgi:DNA-binding NarL/FixJ family response regulator